MNVPTGDARNGSTMKVLQCRGLRLAVRLENIFWAQLEELAQQRNLTLAKYVHHVLQGASSEENRTSLLRCHCLRVARDAKMAARLSENDVNLTLLLTACPAPAFLLKDERTIVAHNPAFAARFMTDQNQAPRAFVRISYTQPFSRLRDFLIQNPVKALNTLLVLHASGKTHNCRARLLLVGTESEAYVLAFLEGDISANASQ